MNWKRWTALGLGLAIVITLIVLHLVQPEISYAWNEVFCAVAFVTGFIISRLWRNDNKG
jgi:hypothetical protein